MPNQCGWSGHADLGILWCVKTADERTIRLYLLDLGREVAGLATAAKAERNAAHEDTYALGRLMAFHEVVSLMQHQARAFGMGDEEVGLAGIDPERDLL